PGILRPSPVSCHGPATTATYTLSLHDALPISAIRNRKEVQVARYQRRRHLAIRIGAPVGAGPLLSGRTAVGIVLVTLIVAAILGAIGGPHPPIFGACPPSLRAAFFIPLVIAVAAP